MKQSTGRLLGARLLSRPAALGIGMAAAVVAGISACGGGGNNNCHNIPQATGLIGQPNFNQGTPNNPSISGLSLGGVQGSVAVLPNPSAPTDTATATVYVADTTNNRILGFTGIPSGINTAAASFVIGQSSMTDQSSGIGPQGSVPIKFANPSKVWIATTPTNTYLAVADSGNNRVLIWNTPPKDSTTGPDIVLGQPNLTTAAANQPNATPSSTGMDHPTAVIISSKGQVVVVDKSNNRVLIWNTVPTTSNVPADLELGQVATDSSGTTTCTANTGTAGYCFTTNVPNIDQFNGITNILAMRQPSDAWTDGSNLLVSDTGNNRVLYWAGVPNNMNKLPDNLLGATQFGSYNPAGGSGSQAFNAPWGVASDGTSVFVGDSGNNRVLEFQSYITTPKNGTAATVVFGQQDFTHITQNDPDQNGAVADQRNDPATSGVNAGTMFSPQGLYVNASYNVLLVSDSANSRVMRFPIIGTSSAGPNTNYGVDGTNTDDGNFCF